MQGICCLYHVNTLFFTAILFLEWFGFVWLNFKAKFLNTFLTHFMPLISFDNPWKILVFWCFQGVSKEINGIKLVKIWRLRKNTNFEVGMVCFCAKVFVPNICIFICSYCVDNIFFLWLFHFSLILFEKGQLNLKTFNIRWNGSLRIVL